MKAPSILLFRGRGLLSAAIRWQTRSRYSHAAILLHDEQTIIEAWPGAGVRAKSFNGWDDWDGIDYFSVDADFNSYRLENFLHAQLGKRYDYLGVLRFLSRDSDEDQKNKRWFCSELVFAAFAHAGVDLFRDTRAWEVSPGMLSKSQLLKLHP
jgi:uncharacterized protein YycO